nr:cadherin-like domain-containing protein [Wenzhouxiangella sp. XN201]
MNFALDGDLTDWDGVSPVGQDPAGDATDGSSGNDLLAGFAALENETLYFRIDVVDLQNTAPTATADAYATDEDVALAVTAPGVLGNDTDPESDPLTATLETGPANADSFTLNPDGSFDYTPAPDFNGSDSFTYVASDGQAESAPATVTITIEPVNDVPSAQDDAFDVNEDQTLSVAAPGVLDNDSDIESDPLTALLDAGPSSAASFTLNADGSFEYVPVPDFNGSDSFTYVASDGTDDSAPATVAITIHPVNDPPSAINDAFTVAEDSLDNSLDVLANDSTAPDTGEILTITAVGATDQGGTATTDGATVSYSPAADFVGTETFTYTIDDGNGGNDSATITITVENTNDDPPVCTADFASTDEDNSTLVDVLVNDADPDPGQTATLTVMSVDDTGTVGQVVNNGTDVTYDPDGQFESLGAGDDATDTFSYTAQDSDGLTCTATVTVTVTGVDDPAVAADDQFRTVGNTMLEVGDASGATSPSVFVTGSVLNNDSDPDNTLAVSGTNNVTAGAIVNMATDGTFTYLPPPGLRGDGDPNTPDDSFQYELSGGEIATVSIDIDGLVWYVDNTSNGGSVSAGEGTSDNPFSTLSDGNSDTDPNDAEDAADDGDIIYVMFGDGTATHQGSGLTLGNGQSLLGEGVDLVVDVDGTPTTLFTGDPTRQPVIDVPGSGLNGVSVIADTGDRLDIEIRGLSIAADANAVDVSSANGHAVDVTIAENFIAGASEEGLDLNPDSSGAFFATIAGNRFATSSVAGNAIDLTTGATSGDVNVAVDNNFDITSSGGSGIVLNNFQGGAELYVTSFSNNSVHGNTANRGILIDSVTFDADPADPDFTGDSVSGGNLTVGAPGNPVGTTGIELLRVAGRLEFDELSAYSEGAGGTGLQLFGSGTIDAGAGTGFELTANGGEIDAENGAAVSLGAATLGLAFDTVSSTDSTTYGISLGNVTGSFSAAAGLLSGAAGITFNLTNGSPTVNYGGTINHSANTGVAVNIEDNNGASATFGGAVSVLGGSGVQVVNNSGTNAVNFSGPLDLGTSSSRLSISPLSFGGNSAGTTLTAPDIDLFTSGPPAIVASGAGTLDLDAVSIDASSGGGVDIDGVQLLVDIDTLTCTRNSSCVDLTNLAAGSLTTFANVDLTCTSNNCFNAQSARTIEVTGTGNRIDAENGRALHVVDTTIGAGDITFESISASISANAITLDNTGTLGGLVVTGDTGVAQNGSGGTLTGITGNAIELIDTGSISLDQLDMFTVGGHGIAGIRVDGISVSNAVLTSVGNGAGDDVFSFNRNSFGDNGLTGTAVFENVRIPSFSERALDIFNEGGGSLDLQVTDSSISNNSIQEDAIRVQTTGTLNADVLLANSNFDSIEFDVLTFFAEGSGSHTVEVTGITSTNGGGSDNFPNGGGVAIIGSDSSSISFDIDGNSLTGVQGEAVQIIGLGGAGQTLTLNGIIGGVQGNTFASDNADGIDLDFDGDSGGGSTINGAIVVQNNSIAFDDDGIGVDFRDSGGQMNITIRNNTINGAAGDDGVTTDLDDGIFVFTDNDVGAGAAQLNVEIFDNLFNDIDSTKNLIEIVDVRDGNNACFGATGNSIGAGGGSIELDTDAAANLVVDADSAANLSALNNGINVNEVATPTYNSGVDCIP